MYNTPKPRPQFNGSGVSNFMEGSLDFDQKHSTSTSSAVTTTPSTSNSSSTPGTSSFGAESGYFEEISNMIDNSGLETPQVTRLNGSQLFGKVIDVENNGNCNNGQYTLGSSGNGNCGKNTFNGKTESPSVNLIGSADSKQSLNIDGYHRNSGITKINGDSNVPANNGNYRHQVIIPGGTNGVGIVSNIFSSPGTFDCAVASTRSTSDTFTPSVGRDDCSPQYSLSDSPGSDPFSISTFRSEQICRENKTLSSSGANLIENTSGVNINSNNSDSTNSVIVNTGMGRVGQINKDGGSDSIGGDFSAPILNYFNDGLSTDSWGGFIPYTNLIDYCFDGGSTRENGMIMGAGNGIDAVCSTENNNGNDSSGWLISKNITADNFLSDMTESEGSKGSVSKTMVNSNNGIQEKAEVSAATGSIIIPNNSAIAGISGRSPDSLSTVSSSSHALKANDIVEKLILDIVNSNRQQNVSINGVFDQVSEILTLALSSLGSKFNKNTIYTKNKSRSDSSVQSLQAQNNNWGQNSLGVGGPNFAAPTMLAHPDEFKNPSSFLKIYGDPLCGKSTTGSGSNNNSSQNTTGSNSGICTTDLSGQSVNPTNNGNTQFANINNPTKGQNGNWACSKCNNVNFPRRFRCFKCGEYRDEAGDKIVAEYAKHVYLHHLRAYRSFGNNWIFNSVGGATGSSQNSFGFSGTCGSSFTSGNNKGVGGGNHLQISGLGQEYLEENGTRNQQQTVLTHGCHKNGFLSNPRSGLKDNRENGGVNGVSPNGGGGSHTSKKHQKTFLIATGSQSRDHFPS
ncbi:hypothetical protein FG386_003421 [Cryptosporidium ryanae]|uniref:uncharacterized protein n=1 Tax=Cryptosporidium ryanae TaxID=515981 RepID=UPI003519DB79|nr:hypothetical protein FG386_003421 [Cryptosporidium ryanae]